VLEGNVVILERPIAHKANSVGSNSVDDKFRIVDRSEILSKERVCVPDFLQQSTVCKNGRRTSDADLVVMIIQITQFDLRVGSDFDRLMVTSKIRHIDGESLGANGRNRPHTRLITIDRSQMRKAIGLNDRQSGPDEFIAMD